VYTRKHASARVTNLPVNVIGPMDRLPDAFAEFRASVCPKMRETSRFPRAAKCIPCESHHANKVSHFAAPETKFLWLLCTKAILPIVFIVLFALSYQKTITILPLALRCRYYRHLRVFVRCFSALCLALALCFIFPALTGLFVSK